MNQIYVYACDDTYAPLAGVSMLSLLENNKNEEQLSVYILSDGISQENINKLIQIGQEYKRSVVTIDVRDKIEQLTVTGITGYKNAAGSAFAAYARLIISELLPTEIKRVVYLDCDTLICRNASGLFSQDLAGKALSMAYDCLRNEYKAYIGIEKQAAYYNSGVLIIDMELWKSHRCMERIIDHIRNVRSDYPLVDQDLINVALADDICELSPDFNYLSQYFLYKYTNIIRVYGLSKTRWYSKEVFEFCANKPYLYHFCGKSFIRPWFLNSCHPMKSKYDEYYYASPWKDCPQKKCDWSTPYYIQYWLYKHTSQNISSTVGLFMQRWYIFSRYKC